MNVPEINNPGVYKASDARYDYMEYRRCGKSGILLPAISLGLWHNFGFIDNTSNGRNIVRAAFDMGITHFDLANNYGPPYGSAEEVFGTIMKGDFLPYRDELLISTKAGYDMWPGPYGNFGSRKYLIASLDQSLRRMGLDYVDIFYHHRPDPDTPLEETMSALDQVVRQGKALYAGISNYPPELTSKAIKILKDLGTPCLIHQTKYSMFERTPEDGLLDVLGEAGVGCIAFSPLAQGMLTDKYLKGIPDNSRAARPVVFLTPEQVQEKLPVIHELHQIAIKRDQKLSQMALAWLLKDKSVTSVLVGASSVEQLKQNVLALENKDFSTEELVKIEVLLNRKK